MDQPIIEAAQIVITLGCVCVVTEYLEMIGV